MTIFCKENRLVLNENQSNKNIKIKPNTTWYSICRKVNRVLPAALVASQDCLSNSTKR